MDIFNLYCANMLLLFFFFFAFFYFIEQNTHMYVHLHIKHVWCSIFTHDETIV